MPQEVLSLPYFYMYMYMYFSHCVVFFDAFTNPHATTHHAHPTMSEARRRAQSHTVQIMDVEHGPTGDRLLIAAGTGVHVVVADARSGRTYSAVITAAHVVRTKRQARRRRVIFSAVAGHPRREVDLDADTLFITCAPRMDVSIIALNETVARGPALEVYAHEAPPDDHLQQYHHAGGAARVQYAYGHLVLASHDLFAFNTPSAPGASGSPVFTSDFRLFGISVAENVLVVSPHHERPVTEAHNLVALIADLKRRGLTIAQAPARASAPSRTRAPPSRSRADARRRPRSRCARRSARTRARPRRLSDNARATRPRS